jgi:hypothetical protein
MTIGNGILVEIEDRRSGDVEETGFLSCQSRLRTRREGIACRASNVHVPICAPTIAHALQHHDLKWNRGAEPLNMSPGSVVMTIRTLDNSMKSTEVS